MRWDGNREVLESSHGERQCGGEKFDGRTLKRRSSGCMM
jgi:hypothetical protein